MLEKNEIPKILEKYLNYLIAVKGCSLKTKKEFSSDLMQFFNFIQKYKKIQIPIKEFNIFTVLEVKEADIIAFLVYLNYNRDNSPYTRQRKIVTLRSFYKWLFCVYSNTTKYQKNPTLNLDSIKKVERLPKYLTLNQAKKIQKIFNLSNTRYPERNNAIISLFLSSGIRLSELININLKDINFENNSIVVLGKNSKERTVYFNNYSKLLILEYIKLRNPTSKNEPLFLNRFGDRIGTHAIECICKKAYKLIGVEDLDYTPHTLRHTAATIMYRYVEENILLIKEFLGHSSLVSTEIYTHVYNSKLKQAVERHPLNYYKKEGSR